MHLKDFPEADKHHGVHPFLGQKRREMMNKCRIVFFSLNGLVGNGYLMLPPYIKQREIVLDW